jgi:hypothetical protein
MDQANNATEQCMQGNHFIYDSSSHNYVNVGPCEKVHEAGDESEADPKMQVVGAAQGLMNKIMPSSQTIDEMFPYGSPSKNFKKGIKGQ